MNAEPTPPPGDPATHRGSEAEEIVVARPWTPEAAMEPVPPLAPPPARPGAGTPVAAAARVSNTGPSHRTVAVIVIALALVVVATVILVLVLGH